MKYCEKAYLVLVIGRVEVFLFSSVQFLHALPTLAVQGHPPWRTIILAEQRRVGLRTVTLHLVEAQNQVLEGVDVGDVFEFLAVFLHNMQNEWLDIFPFDKLEKFETSRIEKVVAGHGFINDIQNETEGVVMCHEGLVEGVLEADQCTEELEGN